MIIVAIYYVQMLGQWYGLRLFQTREGPQTATYVLRGAATADEARDQFAGLLQLPASTVVLLSAVDKRKK